MLRILLSIFILIFATELPIAAGAADAIAPKPSGTVTYHFTTDQLNQQFLTEAAVIPSALIAGGITRIGQLDLRLFIKQISLIPIQFELWSKVANGTPSGRFFTRFNHGTSNQKNSQRIFVNAQLWFRLPQAYRPAVSLNAALSALGYNDSFYQMTTALWFFSQTNITQALTKSEYNYAWRLAETISVKLSDAPPVEPMDRAEPLASQLPPHYGKITQSSALMPSLGVLHANGFTTFIPVDGAVVGNHEHALVNTQPFIPRTALTNGGGDWGGIFLKQSMIHANYELQTGPDRNTNQGKILEGFRLTMVLGFEINWIAPEEE